MPKKKGTLRCDKQYEYKGKVGETIDGKAIRKSFYSPTSQAEARKKYDEHIVQKEISERAERQQRLNCTFEEWAIKWLEVYKKGKCKDNTYTGTFEIPVNKHLIPYFGSRIIRVIKPLDIQMFFDEKSKTCSLEYLRKFRACLFSIFDTAAENEYCDRNPVTRNIKLISNIAPPEKTAWKKSDYNKAIKIIKAHSDGLSVWLMAETGISRSELLGIRRDAVDCDNRIISIENGTVELKDSETGHYTVVTDGLKNKYRRRLMPIADDELLKALRAVPDTIYIGGNKKKGIAPTPVKPEFLFCSPAGKVFTPSNWSKRVFSKVMDAIVTKYPEIPRLSPHELRHTRATLWKNDKVDLFSLARLLGHCDLDMLAKRYAHDDIDAVKAALGMVAKNPE